MVTIVTISAPSIKKVTNVKVTIDTKYTNSYNCNYFYT